ncbi:hypothetical protein AVENLUH5627_00111 [Acinetobacter venetianus]|uniref:Uncharacterized protein n=1 Tax=Acinetobacter venetianus TaxID=52133 RepID=A0A150I2U0_9GAMM|nr:hypothetical protein [Acinetobacter venetianus]KXZ74176.1 hypothetical protein AVENLUH5627_00111 [Acinetobacter venetianus]
MAIYRDDALEGMIFSDSTWLRLMVIAEDRIVFSDSNLSRIKAHFEDSFSLADEITQTGAISTAVDGFSLFDQITGQRIARGLVSDQVKLFDAVYRFTAENIEDQFTLGDFTLSTTLALSTDSIHFVESISGQRYSRILSNDQFKLTDLANTVASEQVVDSILLSDFTQDKLRAQSYLIDSINFGDQDLSSVQLYSHAIDTLRLGDSTQSKLNGRTDSNDYFSIYDELKDSKAYGQAWTANINTWAMSRYMPYNFDGLSVINGKLYGWNGQGVYLMIEQAQHNIQAMIETGKIDFGESLVHPIAAYLEYEMSGQDKQLSIAVTSTQSGKPTTYTYMLPNEEADNLTNGRVLFGRGLRGRHFSFTISIAATSAKINALSMDFTKTTRRI